ncbi:MAG: DNA mismatch repair endonuclease MutL [Gemmataceae bacterium]|nr:DNA mismatch repair endonuclease MutL [Gemmataceae bacterium]
MAEAPEREPARIRPLDPVTVSQIAAGEVVERPASVLRELLDNALDSGATRISIEVDQGGIDRILVVDNGTGILPDDLPLALASHATSKLHHAGELEHITSMGFRGEALASIASVSRLSLESHPPGLGIGGRIQCEGGVPGAMEPWAGSPGTRVEVRHLFYNAPVRRRFLKSQAAEMAQLNEVFNRFALAIAAIPAEKRPHLSYKSGKKSLHEIPGDLPLLDRVSRLFGQDVANQLHAVDAKRGVASLTGFIADPSVERATARMQYLFLNGRFLKDRSLTHAVQEAYRGLIMVGRQPVVFLHLQIPPEDVDVNVHPAKAEVRFRDPSAVHHLVFRSLRDRMDRENLTTRLTVPKQNPFAPTAPFALQPPPPPPPRLPFPEPSRSTPTTSAAAKADSPASFLVETNQLGPPPSESNRILQIYNSFLLAETEEGLLVIDQHALHERVIYEQIKRRLLTGKLPTQGLLLPELVELSPEQAGAVEQHRDSLLELGFDLAHFGGATWAIQSYPAILEKRPIVPCLLSAVQQITSKSQPPSRDQLLQEVMSLMACHSAVRAGERLSPDLMEALLEMRHLAKDTHHCPHGRPTALVFSKQELDRQFGRIG